MSLVIVYIEGIRVMIPPPKKIPVFGDRGGGACLTRISGIVLSRYQNHHGVYSYLHTRWWDIQPIGKKGLSGGSRRGVINLVILGAALTKFTTRMS